MSSDYTYIFHDPARVQIHKYETGGGAVEVFAHVADELSFHRINLIFRKMEDAHDFVDSLYAESIRTAEDQHFGTRQAAMEAVADVLYERATRSNALTDYEEFFPQLAKNVVDHLDALGLLQVSPGPNHICLGTDPCPECRKEEDPHDQS